MHNKHHKHDNHNSNSNEQIANTANPYINSGTQNNEKLAGTGKQNNQNMGQNPYMNNTNTNNSMGNMMPNSGFSTKEILTGALIGAAATYILTNDNVQKTLFKGILSAGDILSGGFDEVKERFEDAKAEHEASKDI